MPCRNKREGDNRKATETRTRGEERQEDDHTECLFERDGAADALQNGHCARDFLARPEVAHALDDGFSAQRQRVQPELCERKPYELGACVAGSLIANPPMNPVEDIQPRLVAAGALRRSRQATPDADYRSPRVDLRGALRG